MISKLCGLQILSILRRDARRQDGLEMLGPVTIDACEIFVSHAAQSAAEFMSQADCIEFGPLRDDRLDRLDVVLDQLGGYLGEVGGVLDDPAQAFCRNAGRRETKGGGVSLDVVGSAEKLAARRVGKSIPDD